MYIYYVHACYLEYLLFENVKRIRNSDPMNTVNIMKHERYCMVWKLLRKDRGQKSVKPQYIIWKVDNVR